MSEQVRYHEIVRPTIELAVMAKDYSQIAYHGVKAAIADRRSARAGSVMENMEHKDALYTDLAAEATTGTRTITETSNKGDWDFLNGRDHPEDAVAQGAKSRNVVERFMHSRLEKRQFKRGLAEAKRKRVLRIYSIGGEQNERTNTMGVQTRLMTSARKAGVNVGYYKGNMSPQEKRLRNTVANTDLIPTENAEQKRSRKALEKRHSKTQRVAKQPVLTPWRSVRKNGIEVGGENYGGAINNIQRHHHRAEKHKKKAAKARARLS